MHGDLHSQFGVNLHLVVIVTVQLAGKVAQDALEERVDGTDVELTVVIEHTGQCFLGRLLHLQDVEHPLVEAVHLLFHPAEVAPEVAIFRLSGQKVQLLDDAVLHLLGSLVGECDGQNVAMIVIGLAQPQQSVSSLLEEQQHDVPFGQGVGLS